MSLPLYEPRCQGAIGGGFNPIAAGALCKDCIKCERRTDVIPGHQHAYIQPPRWAWWETCPKRVAPREETT